MSMRGGMPKKRRKFWLHSTSRPWRSHSAKASGTLSIAPCKRTSAAWARTWAILSSVTSSATPTRRTKRPSARSPTAWPRASIQVAPPSGRVTRNETSKAPWVAAATMAWRTRSRCSVATRSSTCSVVAMPPPPQPSMAPVISDMNSSPDPRRHSQMPQRAASTATRKRSSESARARASPSARSPWITSSTARIAANTIGVNSTLAETSGVWRMRRAVRPISIASTISEARIASVVARPQRGAREAGPSPARRAGWVFDPPPLAFPTSISCSCAPRKSGASQFPA